MPKVKKLTFLQINLFFYLLFLASFFAEQAKAQLDIGNSDLTREIEKTLLFDKSDNEKFDVYNNEYGTNLVDKPTLGEVKEKDEEEKKYTPEEMNIVMIDKVKIDKDLREKEKSLQIRETLLNNMRYERLVDSNPNKIDSQVKKIV